LRSFSLRAIIATTHLVLLVPTLTHLLLLDPLVLLAPADAATSSNGTRRPLTFALISSPLKVGVSNPSTTVKRNAMEFGKTANPVLLHQALTLTHLLRLDLDHPVLLLLSLKHLHLALSLTLLAAINGNGTTLCPRSALMPANGAALVRIYASTDAMESGLMSIPDHLSLALLLHLLHHQDQDPDLNPLPSLCHLNQRMTESARDSVSSARTGTRMSV